MKEAFKLPEVQKQAAAIKKRSITINPYTTLSSEMIESELANVQQIAEQKKPHLESMIEYKKLNGISPDQYAEMETLFKEADADSSNSISAKELRSCLFSLGEERSKSEIDNYMKTYGKGKALSFEQFRSLMTVLIGDIGTKDSLTESFKVRHINTLA